MTQMPAMDLGYVDNFNDSNYIIVFIPESKTTQEIMSKVASVPFMKGMFSATLWKFSYLKNTHLSISLKNCVKSSSIKS